MADEAEDVLELTPLEEVEQTDGEAEGDETVISFADAEAAPASESESSVIRDLRRANRELAKKVSQAERSNQPQKIEVGPKPTLAGCEFDEERFESDLDEWKERTAKAAQADREAEERNRRYAEEGEQNKQAYVASKSALRVPDFDDAEAEVFSALPDQHQALLMLSKKSAALVYALAKSPKKLDEFSKLDLARAAIMVGEMGVSLNVTTRKIPQPDRPVIGTASNVSDDKHLARLEKDAERTGIRTELIRYRKSLAR